MWISYASIRRNTTSSRKRWITRWLCGAAKRLYDEHGKHRKPIGFITDETGWINESSEAKPSKGKKESKSCKTSSTEDWQAPMTIHAIIYKKKVPAKSVITDHMISQESTWSIVTSWFMIAVEVRKKNTQWVNGMGHTELSNY